MVIETRSAEKCSACGTPLSREPWSEGLCPSCVFSLALEDSAVEADLLVAAGEAPTLRFTPDQTFNEGEIQGDRYRIRSLLGRGGMGEVWRAYDLKLRQDVALKALRTELIADKPALETLRQEVRTAREVISPNVCRVYDLQEVDGQELVAMEYVDGTTLQEILKERGPLELNEAREIATQFLAGLEAIHEAGLIHRDIKPENVMVTRTGRVVVMDFGLAKGLGEGRGGMVAGTPAYMSPEQSRGGELDARADLFSAGVVLAEMVEPGGLASFDDRRRVWEGIHQESPQCSETPWVQVIKQAVAPDQEERFATASALARALEEVTIRAAGDETARPYPGLSAFQEEDAQFFFGRELEVEALWKKLRRPHLLAVIGPSGAGKSSFLRAGLLPTLTDGWQAIITTPGNRPFDRLARSLAADLGEAPGVLELLSRFAETDIAVELLAQWGRRQPRGLLIVDQFEELFTQNSDDVQRSFAQLLGRLPLEADLHVLLSMRDDFLMYCHRFEALRPVFSEPSPLDPPLGAALRRALVEPALKCGYRFEEESIIEEMLGEVEGQRGALPLLAFAAAQLWERRDRDSGLLARKSYAQIGGVSGALAQHAEAMIDYIGEPNVPIVRELFRNLVTAQSTRASRDRDELLSVFPETEGEPFLEPSKLGPTPVPKPQRPAAKHVLDSLIDARLLTSYETPADREGGDPRQRIEIVHESLLANWPRLVRWRMQDAEGAKLREELRAQAKLWDEHGRSEDYLWTGTAFKEYELWRERYPGGLTDTEEAFARAMTSLAARRRRRRRIAVTVVVVLAMIVAAVTGGLWLRAEGEARRAEASKLLALAQLRIETDPTEALAFTTASLELADTEESRVFAMKALGEGPPVLALDHERSRMAVPSFSPDGEWLALAGVASEDVLVWHQDGSGPVVLGGHPASPDNAIQTGWTSRNELVTGHETEGRARVWSFPGGELVRQIDLGTRAWWEVGGDHLLAQVSAGDPDSRPLIAHLRSWRLPDGEPEELGTVDLTALGVSKGTPISARKGLFEADGRGWIYCKGREIFYRPLPAREGVPDRLIGSHEHEAQPLWPAESDRLWTRDTVTAELRLWDLSAPSREPLQILPPMPADEEGAWFQPVLEDRWLLESASREGKARLWDPLSLPGADPRDFKRSGRWFASVVDFHPSGDWFVASTKVMSELSFWPLKVSQPTVVTGYDWWGQRPVVFTPDGRWLATWWKPDKLRLWPLPGSGSRQIRELEIGPLDAYSQFGIDAAGEHLFLLGYGPVLSLLPLEGGEARRLEGFTTDHFLVQGAFSPSGRLAAAATAWATGEPALRVWDLDTGEVMAFDLSRPMNESVGERESSSGDGTWVLSLAFADKSTLFTAGGNGVFRWDLEAGTYERILSAKAGQVAHLWLSGDRQQLMTGVEDPTGECHPLVLHDLAASRSRELDISAFCQGEQGLLAFDEDLSLMAAAGPDGTLWVGRVGSEVPHLLTGHQGTIVGLAISPDRRWIASSGDDKTLRLWPMPDLDEPPLHTLPREELLAKLRSLTNLRAVRDETSSTGWSIEVGPFPGWAEVPEW